MRILAIGVLVLIFVTACSTEKLIGGDTDEHGCLIAAGYSWCEPKQKCLRIWEENCTTDSECLTDDDCVTGGCSGTVCQSKDAEPVYTTCVYLPEYECYKEIGCVCEEGKCKWDITKEFEECVEEKRKG